MPFRPPAEFGMLSPRPIHTLPSRTQMALTSQMPVDWSCTRRTNTPGAECSITPSDAEQPRPTPGSAMYHVPDGRRTHCRGWAICPSSGM
jgi:hypothetical protein